MFKQTFRQDAKHFRGFRSTNNGIDLKNNQNKAYVKIMPVGVGRLSNIKQKGQSIFGRAFIEKPQSSDKYKTLYVNPLWGYLFLIATSYQKIFVSQNKTQIEFEEDFTKQVIRELRYQILEKKVKQILLDRINYVFDNLEIAFRRIMKKEGINNASRSQKLYFFKKWMAEQGENVKPATKQFLRKSFNQKNGEMDMFQKYVDQLLLSIQDIQPLKISQQTIKFKNFDKIHRETFKAQFITEKIRGVNNFYIKVAKLSSESEPVLQRLNDFVQLRLSSGVPEAEYKTETVSFIRDLYTQMQKYQNNTGKTGCRTPYYYLNPENIIVDQLTLTPKLHYEPALLQAFGLRRNCFSLESRLSFQPTPKGPDFFRSLEELDQANQLKLRDPLYGEIEFYYLDIAKMTSDEMREIKIEKIELQKLKVLIAIWRFLLVSYYINTGKKFGRKLNPISYLEVQKHFQKSLKQKKNQLKKNACELKQFLGVENRRFEGVQFQWKLQEIGEYLQLQNDESIIKDHKFTKKLRYFILRWTLIGQLNSALRNNKVIPKFLNVKRYILMYLFNAHEIYVENMELLEVQKIKSGQRKILRKLIEHKSQELRKDYFSDAKSNLDNINKYLTRNPEKDPQTKYLASSKYFHNLLIGILDQLDKINTICQQLNTIENKEQNNIPLLERNQYKNKLLKLQERLNEGYRKVHIITGQFVTLQIFNKSIDQLYKYTDQQKQRDFNKLQKKKIALQFYTYLSLNLNKYFLYQTAVAPLIVSYRGLNQNEQPVLIDHQKLEEQNYKLQAIEQAIELKNIIGKQLQYLKNPNDQSTQAEKISSDIPNNQLNSHLKQDKQKFVNPKLWKGGKNKE